MAARSPQRPGQAGEGIGGGQRKNQGDKHDGDADDDRVTDELKVGGVVEEGVQMFKRWVLAEDEGLGTAIEIAIGLEGVHEHNEEGRGGEEAESQDKQIKGTAPQDIR